MDREIKFRGKYIKDGDWIYGGYGYLKKSKKHFITNQRAFFRVFPETVGQFTGCKDVDGVEIFEGDIISFAAFGDPVELVHVEGSSFGIGGKNGLPKHSGDAFTVLSDLLQCYEVYVIGNIHDNPELLEGSKEND